MRRLVRLVLMLTLLSPPLPLPGQPAPPVGSDLSGRRLKGSLERRVEAAIEAAYRRCLRRRTVAGRELLLRIPFGQNGERNGPGFVQRIYLGGKGSPEEIWQRAEELLASQGFARYLEALRRPGEKLLVFDLARRSWSAFFDPGLIGKVKAGPYPGTRARVYVLRSQAGVSEADLYNYLYCIGALGMDCSGFVYYVQQAVAEALGVDLDRKLAGSLRVAPQRVPQLVGLWLFDPRRGFAERVPDNPAALRPGDVFLFRGRVPGRGLDFRHSAVIQSVDPQAGVVRYLQCTDWAPQPQRGVHDSRIRFDPGAPQTSLKDPLVEWSQEILPAFPGEPGLRYWRNDGDRFVSYMEADGSLVVRLRAVKRLLEATDPDYYRAAAP